MCQFCRRAAGDLDDEHVARNAAPFIGAVGCAHRHVVAHADGARVDPLGAEELCRHVEVHVVAGIIAIDEDHALAPVDGEPTEPTASSQPSQPSQSDKLDDQASGV